MMDDASVPNPQRAAEISAILVARLRGEMARLRADFGGPDASGIRCCWLDDVLPPRLIAAAQQVLPPVSAMVRRANRKERKFVSANLDALGPPISDLILGFARQPVADAVAEVMGKARLEVDRRLYNGGITAMLPGDFMCPHLDNSHDYARTRRRDVVLLYYLSPDWRDEDGGTLELWDRPGRPPARAIPYRSNRLVIMETTDRSWHSIRPIVGPRPRISLTSYFYAPATEKSRLRLTRFTAWPGQPVNRLLFSGEFHLRSVAARLIGRRLVGNRHAYRSAAATPIPAGPMAGGAPSGGPPPADDARVTDMARVA
jgi:hypothetical protein